MAVWLIRGGKDGQREALAIEKNCAIVGWEDLPDLSGVKNRDSLKELLQQTYPNEKSNTLRNWESQIWPLLGSIAVGDLISLPMKTTGNIALGMVAGSYQYRDFGKFGRLHTLPVEWKKELPRDRFDQDILYSLGAFMTVCRIKRNNAEARIIAMMTGGKVKLQPKESLEDADDEAAIPDIEQAARDGIRLHLTQKFKGHKLAELVGSLFVAQGFKVKVKPPGPDGGIDIIAGRGELGFDEPRLAIQVKSQDSPIDIKELREFQQVIKDFGASHGIFVAWGGYKSTVMNKADELYFGLRLWNADDLISALQDNYENLPEAIRLELPMKRLWALVPSMDTQS